MAIFEQRLADPLGDAAMRLAVQDQRIDRAADIVDRGIADDLDLAGIGIDLDLADLRAIGKARDRQGLVGDAGKRSVQSGRQVVALHGGGGDLEEADLAVGAGDPEAAGSNSMSARRPRAGSRRSCGPCR